MKRSEKDAIIDEMVQRVSAAQAMYFADFTGLSVADVTELRREFRKAGVGYTVGKNTLIRKALERVSGYDKVVAHLAGPTGVAFCGDDISAPARIIKKFKEKTGKLSLKAAILERQVFEGSAIDQLAQIPTRKELMAGVVGSIQAPLQGVVGVVNALARDLVSIIDQIGQQKKAA
ncbi:MAG: 50S ribosomal protein L10 [Bacteroidota bacterium]